MNPNEWYGPIRPEAGISLQNEEADILWNYVKEFIISTELTVE